MFDLPEHASKPGTQRVQGRDWDAPSRLSPLRAPPLLGASPRSWPTPGWLSDVPIPIPVTKKRPHRGDGRNAGCSGHLAASPISLNRTYLARNEKRRSNQDFGHPFSKAGSMAAGDCRPHVSGWYQYKDETLFGSSHHQRVSARQANAGCERRSDLVGKNSKLLQLTERMAGGRLLHRPHSGG